MRILRLTCNWIVLIAAVAAQVCAGNGHNSGGAPRSPSVTPPPPTRIEFWRSGSVTGFVSVDVQNRRIRALGTHLTRQKGLHAMEGRITASEARALRKVATAVDLRGFRPRSEWFTACKSLDGSAFLLIVWKDKEAVFAIPPGETRSWLRSSAERAYKCIDSISRYTGTLESKYAGKLRLTNIPRDDARAKRFYRQLDAVVAKSLPKDRKGW